MNNMLSIVIVNYNGMKYLSECLESIARHVTVEHEVIIVDNASTDGSREYAQRMHPKVCTILNDGNLGFSAANNIGVRHAIGDLLLMLNNDTKLLTPLDPAVRKFVRDSSLGAVGCRMYYGDRRFQPSIGYEHTPMRVVLSWTGLGAHPNAPSIFKLSDNNEVHYAEPQKSVSWVSGAFLMTRKDLWDRLGGLDEKYFMYVEEVDYCTRVGRAGYRIAYDPSVEIIHYCGSARTQTRSNAFKNTMSSYIVYINKFYGRWTGLFFRVALTIVMATRGIILLAISTLFRNRSARDKSRAYASAVHRLLLK